MIANHDDNGTEQLQYVNMTLGGALIPFITPETILVSEDGKMLWDHEGAIDETSLKSAIKIIGEYK